MKIVNLTPHAINIKTKDGIKSYQPFFQDAKNCPRNAVEFQNTGNTIDDTPIFTAAYGETDNLPPAEEGVCYIVSSMVLDANKNRKDLLAPATGHKDTERNEKGHIVNVPGFVCN